MRIITGTHKIGLVYNKLAGPWPCEKCGQLTQFAKMGGDRNEIFCRNPHCLFTRIIDKRNHTIVEDDGSMWVYDPITSEKVRIRGR